MQLIPLSRYLQRSCALQTQNCTRMRMERPHYSPIHTLDNQSAHVNNTFKDKKIEQEFHSIPILLNPTAWHIYIYACSPLSMRLTPLSRCRIDTSNHTTSYRLWFEWQAQIHTRITLESKSCRDEWCMSFQPRMRAVLGQAMSGEGPGTYILAPKQIWLQVAVLQLGIM